MRTRATNTISGESRLLDADELRAYTNLGRNNAMKLGGDRGEGEDRETRPLG